VAAGTGESNESETGFGFRACCWGVACLGAWVLCWQARLKEKCILAEDERMEDVEELTMICETCRIQRYMFHNHLHGIGVRNGGNRMLAICEAKVKSFNTITVRQIQNSLSAYGTAIHPLLRTPDIIHHLLPASTLFACEERTWWARRCLHWLTWVRTGDDHALMACMGDARMATRRWGPCARITASHRRTTWDWRLQSRPTTRAYELFKRQAKNIKDDQ
jgi:hypothetical protein